MPPPGAAPVLRTAAVLACIMAAASPRDAQALQPLSEFLEHAKTFNPDNRASQATVEQREAEVAVSTGNLEPNLGLNASYSRNQYQIDTSALTAGAAPAGTPVTILTPYNQFDGNITLTVPLINIANWDRRSVSKATLEAARADRVNASISVQKAVTRDYYQLVGYEAVLQSASKNLEVAEHNVKVARDKKENGTGSELDVQRALADQAKASQSVTAARLQVVNARRDLVSLTGVAAEPVSSFPEDDLHEETALEGWMSGADSVPAVKSAEATRKSAEEAAQAARTGWLPTVNGVAQEKFTNSTAFTGGHSAYYLLQIAASWKLDNTVIPQIHAQSAIAAAARASEDKARQSAEDNVYRDWQQVKADIEASRSARVQVAATKLAAALAEDRYSNGVATQLDVLQARQDAFAADVARIQADTDLAYARTALRIDSGRMNSGDVTR